MELESYQEKLLLELEKAAHAYERQALAMIDARSFPDAEGCWRKFQGLNEAIAIAKAAMKKWKAANG